jgi:signal transduction histidine kinase
MAQDLSLPMPPASPLAGGAVLQPLAWPLAIAALVIAALGWVAILAAYNLDREQESARLEALSELRATQASNWLGEKMAQARFAGNSPLGEQFAKWRDEGDTASRDKLLGRLSSFHKASGGHSVLILDSRGDILASEPAQPGPPSPELRAAAKRAIETGSPQFTPFYGHQGPAPAPRVDVVAPLVLSGTPARGLVVLRLDPRQALLPLLAQWPVPSQTAASTLVRRDGDMLVGPMGRNPTPISAPTLLAARVLPTPISSPNLLAARVLRGEVPFGTAVEAIDFKGQEVLGVVRPVKGTDWFLVAKIDRSEVYADARRGTAWIAAAGLLAFLATGAAAHWWRGRQALRLARLERAHQEADRLRLEELVDQRTAELAAKNQSLERAVTDLEAFGASVSHDLRGPLRTVNGFAALLQRSEGPNLSEEGRRKLGRILAGAATMDRMIEDILECSRAERVEMHFRTVELAPLVRELLAEMAHEHTGTQIVVGALPAVRADPTLARQVFANLIGNALKFSSRQPYPRVEIGTLSPGGTRIFVRDNGVGFDGGHADRLYEPFQRLHEEDEFGGTGVGLSIVKRLIERHGGSIEAESVPGVRTTFTFDFGAAPGA